MQLEQLIKEISELSLEDKKKLNLTKKEIDEASKEFQEQLEKKWVDFHPALELGFHILAREVLNSQTNSNCTEEKT